MPCKQMKKYQELESKIAELQKEVDRLKDEEEKQNKLPMLFSRDACIRFLETFSTSDLTQSFAWRDTPQGEDYWEKIFNAIHNSDSYRGKYWREAFNAIHNSDSYEVPKDAIVYIQDLVIKSYQQEFG